LKAKDFISYDIHTGKFFTKRKTPRRIFPDYEGYLVFYVDKQRYKQKANKIAYELGTKTDIPDDKVVLHKNLDKTDFRLINLCLVTHDVFNKISEAHRNITSELKLVPHKTDQFSYVVHWVENNQRKTRLIHDIVPAKKLFLKLQLKFAKILGKYLVLD
jgi:hypothetical protein